MILAQQREKLSKKAQKGRAKAKTLPPPYGGLNTRDSLADMEETDAAVLQNYWSSKTSVDARKGYTPWTSSIIGYVETLMAYSGSTTNKLFAATSAGTIYGVTTQDSYLTDENGNYVTTEDGRTLVIETAGSSTDVTGLTNGRWQYVNFATSGGNYLISANGADDVRSYDGTTWATPTITGVTSANLVHVNAHKERLWFVENGSLRAWYLPTKSIAGAASALDLRSVARKGGYLMAMGTWTIDAGYGVDDLAVWITSNGEVIVYRGTDPASATTWALVGIWEIGSPLGRRCFLKWGGDLLVINRDGVLPMSAALQSSRVNHSVALTDKIKPTFSEAALNYASNFGWQLVFYPNANQLILNVPEVERNRQVQYAMNTIKKTWWPFSGWNAGCWEVFNDILYFGGYQLVGRAWNSNADAGTDISVRGIQAFNYLNKAGIEKRVTAFETVYYTSGSPSVFGGVNVDFDTTENDSSLETRTSLYGTWDTGKFDSALWAPAIDLRKSWNGARGVGNAFAPTINADINGIELQWVNSTIVYEEGAFL